MNHASIAWCLVAAASLQTACGNSISPNDSVLTEHNNSARTGVFRRETKLTPTTVPYLERLYVRRVDGQIAAQPLFVKGVTINGVKKDVLYVVTRNNFIYAFDVDNMDQNDPRNGQAWPRPIRLTYTDSVVGHMKAEEIPGMDIAVPPQKHPCSQTHGPVGITSTPVIDPVSQVMYVVFRVGTARGSPRRVDHHFLAAIDIRTGQELRRTKIAFEPADMPKNRWFVDTVQLNRPGLLLLDNVVYVAFGTAACDMGKYHGWVFAYSTPALQRLAVFNTTPQTWGAGIWQSGSGLAADERNRFVYAFTGDNHNWDFIARNQTGQNPNRDDRYHQTRTELGESILQLRLGRDGFECSSRYDKENCVPEHFTAGNWYRLDSGHLTPNDTVSHVGDSDLGSGGPVVLQNGFVVGGGKQGRVYVLDPNNTMRVARQGFQAFYNTWHLRGQPGMHDECKASPDTTSRWDIIGKNCWVSDYDYDMRQAYGPNIHGSLVVWQRASANYGFVYGMVEKDYLKAFRVFRSGRVEERPAMTTAGAPRVPPGFINGLRSPDGMPGAALSLSSNGDNNAVLWVSLAPGADATVSIQAGILMAFDATTLRLLWFDPDPQVYFAKFVPPTIADGKVFRATFGYNDITCARADRGNTWRSCGAVVVYGLRNSREHDVHNPPP